MRLIDADKLIAQQKEIADDELSKNACPYSWSYAIESFIDDIEEQPTIDAVCVVRCKDCVYFAKDDEHGDAEYCSLVCGLCKENDFCSFGRKHEDDN
jgi:hypothetical protein